MTTKTAGAEGSEEQSTTVIVVEGEEVLEGEAAPPEGEESTTEGEEQELLVAIGAEPSSGSESEEEDIDADIDGQPAPQYVKDLRKKAIEDRRIIRELREKAELAEAAAKAAATGSEPNPVTIVGDKPTLAACDYDEERFAADLEAWHNRKAQADREADAIKAEQTKSQEAEQTLLRNYQTAAAKLPVKDFPEAEAKVLAVLSKMQQAILLRLDNTALTILALGRDPEKLRKLGEEKDPIKFAVQAAYIEKAIQMKTVPKFKGEKKIAGSSGAPPTSRDNTLEKLREEAGKTGDLSKVVAYQVAQRKKAK